LDLPDQQGLQGRLARLDPQGPVRLARQGQPVPLALPGQRDQPALA
jgi:hypothetical protein